MSKLTQWNGNRDKQNVIFKGLTIIVVNLLHETSEGLRLQFTLPSTQFVLVHSHRQTQALVVAASLGKEMAEYDQDEDLTQLITSIVTCALSEEEPPAGVAQPRQRIGSLPLLQQHHHDPEAPQRSSSWRESTTNEESVTNEESRKKVSLQSGSDLQRDRSTRPKVIIPKPSFEEQPWSTRRRTGPLRVSRACQTVTTAIRKIPEEMCTFPVPWGKRLRTVSVGTQTESFAPVVVRAQHVVPSWDPMPEEVFAMDDMSNSLLGSWSLESSFDTPRKENLSSSRYADTTFLNISFDDISLAELSDSHYTATQRKAASWSPAMARDTDVEVVEYSAILQNRTVATNTVHIGWRRPRKIHRNRVLSRAAALGWSSNPDTATVATQTGP